MPKILFFFIFLFYTNIYSQDILKYNIIANDAIIGNIKVLKTQVNKNLIEYHADSETSFKLFLTVNLSYKLNCTYKNKELIFSSVSTFVNGKQHSTATSEKTENNSYILKNNGHEKRLYKPITYSGILLYFKEPKNIKEVFSEFYNNFNPLIQLDTNTYQLTNLENGNKSEYFYKNGILQKAVIHHEIMPFTLEKTN